MIRSNKELVYNSRDNKTAIIEVYVAGWEFCPRENVYYAYIEDYAVIDDVRYFISEKETAYPSDIINGLFNQINENINATDNFTDKLANLISQALLIVTQQNPIYGSEAQDWELVAP